MGSNPENKIGGISLIIGPVLAIVFFLLQPGGLLIDPADASDSRGTVEAFASNPGLTIVTSMLISLGLIMMLYGVMSLYSSQRNSGKPSGLARYGVLFLLIGGIAWILNQGIHFELAGISESAESISAALTTYAVGAGITTMGSLSVALGFTLFGVGVTPRGGLHRTTGFAIAIISLVSLVSVAIGIIMPDSKDAATTIARACYFPWVIWSVWLGAKLMQEE